MGEKKIGGNEYPTGSGGKVLVSASDYEHVMELHDALLDVLRGQGVGALDVAQVQKAFTAAVAKRDALLAGQPAPDEDGAADAGLNVLVDRALAVASSKPFKRALFACAGSALYCPDGRLETALSFDPEVPGYGVFDHANLEFRRRAREDFYDICRAITEENLRPFAKALWATLMGRMAESATSQRSDTAKA